MRNAAPRYRDIEDDEPQGRLSAALGLARRRPVDTLAGALAAACTVMVLVNALAFQEGRHPAPLFAAGQKETSASAPQKSDLVAQIQGALADRGYYDGPVDGLMGARTSAAVRSFEQGQRLESTGEASDRVLAALLVAPVRRTETAPASAAPRAATPAPRTAPAPVAAPATTGSADISGPRLMAVQRALAKLGYGPLASDGKMGAETRNAIQSFERDRAMPQTGEPSPKVLHALQAMTGAPLQ